MRTEMMVHVVANLLNNYVTGPAETDCDFRSTPPLWPEPPEANPGTIGKGHRGLARWVIA